MESLSACQLCNSDLDPTALYCRECQCLLFAADLEMPEEDEGIIQLAQAAELLLSGEFEAAAFHEWLEGFREQQAIRAGEACARRTRRTRHAARHYSY